MGILVMIINYFHDLSVAILASNIFCVWIIGRYLADKKTDPDFMPNLFRKLSRITWIAFTFVILGGGFRAWAFMEYEWNPAVGNGQVTALVIKHIVLVSVTVFGLIVHRKYSVKYGR